MSVNDQKGQISKIKWQQSRSTVFDVELTKQNKISITQKAANMLELIN